MKILFRSCGGLGNQIFQLFYLNCVHRKHESCKIIHFHSLNYNRFADFEFPAHIKLHEPSILELLLIKLRIPVFLRRIGFKKIGYVRIGNLIIVDGYYQADVFYADFSKNILQDTVQELKSTLVNCNKYNNGKRTLVHLRLGDFFRSLDEERLFVLSCLENLEAGSDVISNKDSLFYDHIEIKNLMEFNKLNYINTSTISSLDLFNFFCEYEKIISSGSSLSFAACILNKIEVLPIDNMTRIQKRFFDDLNGLNQYILKL
jgi:hypothetical protein